MYRVVFNASLDCDGSPTMKMGLVFQCGKLCNPLNFCHSVLFQLGCDFSCILISCLNCFLSAV